MAHKQHTYTIGPITGVGFSKTAARDDAQLQAAAALQRMERGPIFVPGIPGGCSEDLGAVVFPTFAAWGYTLVRDSGCGALSTGFTSHLVAIEKAIGHLGDNALDGTTEVLASVITWLGHLRTLHGSVVRIVADLQAHNLERELRRKHAFNAAYFALRKQGHTDTDAHRIACEVTQGT